MNIECIWEKIQAEAKRVSVKEPILAPLLKEVVLKRKSLKEALSYRLSRKLSSHAVSKKALQKIFLEAFCEDSKIETAAYYDIQAVYERDPACRDYLSPALYYKGFQALTCYRIAHFFWKQKRQDLAFYLESLTSEIFAVDIHPAAKIGSGILLDHATGFVAGETTVIENHVSILHEVTLGGTGKECGDRHPKIRHGVLIGAGAKILGNVEIGEGAKVGAGSVVLKDVPPHTTVAGVPAQIVGKSKEEDPAVKMDHRIC